MAEFMNQNSKYSDVESEIAELREFLLKPVTSGQDIVTLSRNILKKYVAVGLSLDDDQIEVILGIESETDTMSPSKHDADDEFSHVYDIYLKPFEACRERILSNL